MSVLGFVGCFAYQELVLGVFSLHLYFILANYCCDDLWMAMHILFSILLSGPAINVFIPARLHFYLFLL